MFFKTRARKKKSLTDPVTIIPFPGQSLRGEKKPVSEQVTKPSVPSLSQQIAAKPEPKILANAGDKIRSTNLSIKKLMNPETGGVQSSGLSQADMPRESFVIDDVYMYWRQFAQQMKEQGRETFYNALIKRNPKIAGETNFLMEVDNLVQVDLINADLEKLTSFMRNALRNYDVLIEVKVTDNQQEDVKHLTGKDKFAMLARKFPNLHALKSTFGLEIEY